VIHIRGRGLRTRLRTARRYAETAVQDASIATLARRLHGSDSLNGRLRPGLLSALTPIAASPGDPIYLFSTRDREIGWSTYRNDGFDEHKSEWVVNRLSGRQKGRTVLDVGANIGTVAIPMVTRYGAARAVALEPEPLNFRLLRCNVLLNGLEDRILCLPVAASDKEQLVDFELSESNYGDHRVRVAGTSEADHMSESQRSVISVNAMPLQRALEGANVDRSEIALVWVDTQGYEGQVLAGAADLRDTPFVVEYWPYGLRRCNGLDLFHEHVAKSFSRAIDITRSIEAGRDVSYSARDLARLCSSLVAPRAHTDLLLLP
jgi:FkbM family methyltransferase